MLMQICKDAGASAQNERIIGIGEKRADYKLSAAAMDDPNGKGAIVDVTRIAPFTHESVHTDPRQQQDLCCSGIPQEKQIPGGLCIR